ncbi:MAG: PAS domain S-box protein [Betaproteobacteria bacterium]|nr:PAS domain S-box protein [Betaproteobacteria bacterium]
MPASSARIRWWILGAVVVVNAFALFFAGVEVLEDKEELELRAEIQTQNLAQAIDQSVSTKIEKIDLFLRMVAHELERELATGEIDKKSIQDRFGIQKQLLSEAGPIRVTDARGTVIIGTEGDAPPSSYASRDYFSYLRDHPEAGLVISKPVIGYLSRHWIVPFTLPYHRPDGAFAGIVGVGVAVDSLVDLISRFDPGERGLITLRDVDLGVIASRRPVSAGRPQIGDRNVSPELKKLVASGARQATFRATPLFDEYRRTVTLRRLEKAPIYALVSMDENSYLAPWYGDIAWKTSFLAVFLLVTSLSAWALWRTWLRQARSAAALREAHEQLASSVAELDKHDARYRSVVETSRDGFWVIDSEGRLVDVNDAYVQRCGFTRDELLGMRIADLEAKETPADIAAHLDTIGRSGGDRFETMHRAKDGSVWPVEVTASYIPDSDGQYLCFLRDISASKRAEAGLARLASIVESSEDAIIMRSPAFRTITWNAAAERMFGYKAEEVIGRDSGFLVPPELRSEVEESRAILEEGRRVPACDTVRVTKDGRRIDVSLSRFPVKDANGRLIGVSVVFRDISERKRVDEALRKARDELERRVIDRTEQLRDLAMQATLTEETERRAIARDLHDGLGQTLHVMRLRLDSLAKTVPDGSQNIVRMLTDQITEASRMVRSLTSELSPPVLAELGIKAALDWLAGEMARSYGLEVVLDDDDQQPPLTKAQSAIVFRTVRELLINVAKHANTNCAWIRFRSADDRLRVTVTDKGVGMHNPEKTLAGGKGYGLASVRERMTYLGSSMEIQSWPGRGTAVTLDIRLEPVRERQIAAGA